MNYILYVHCISFCFKELVTFLVNADGVDSETCLQLTGGTMKMQEDRILKQAGFKNKMGQLRV